MRSASDTCDLSRSSSQPLSASVQLVRRLAGCRRPEGAEVRLVARSGSSRHRTLVNVIQPYANHNGGQLAFGRDGYLYAGLGDGGSAGDPQNNAQNLTSFLGKILRLDTSNPNATWEIVGYGFRNPWRFSFDRLTGDLWVGDVGQGSWEEIDFTPATSPGLENYGWRPYEGNVPYSGESPNPTGTLVFPLYTYSHSAGCSVTGAFAIGGRSGRSPGGTCSGTSALANSRASCR